MRVTLGKLPRILTAKGLREAKTRMAHKLLDQTIERIHNSGQPDGAFAALDFPRPGPRQDRPLWDTGRHLLQSLSCGQDSKSFWAGSNFIGARVHQFGTAGKGGALPTIRPVKAKALFIPMSPKGQKAVKVGPVRVHKKRGGTFGPLKPAKDFILLDHVDINPRPYLKLTPDNLKVLVEVGFG